jgi:hypothetical protein
MKQVIILQFQLPLNISQGVFEFKDLFISLLLCKLKKVKLFLKQAMEAHRVVSRRGSHIFSRQSAYRWQ